MILLSNTDSLTASLGAPATSVNPQFYVAFFDASPDNGVASYGDIAATPLSDTNPVNVIPSPLTNTTVRNLASFFMVNTDTAPIVFSILIDGSVLVRFAMSVGDNLSYSRIQGEFHLFSSSGSLKQTVSMPNVAVTNGPNNFSGLQTFSDTIVPSGGIRGSAVGDQAPAGCVGEVVTSTVTVGSSLALSTGTPLNVTSIVLTAGDWDVDGTVCFTMAATTVVGYLTGGLSSVSATLPANAIGRATFVGAGTNATLDNVQDPIVSPSRIRVNVSVPSTTVFLVAQAKFSIAACKAYGTIYARRAR